MQKLEVEYIETGQLQPYRNNAKIHTDEQIEQIAKSIQEFGMNDPIAVWKDNEIIEGHGRLLACQKLGIKEVPIIRLDGLSDEQRRAYMNVHNQLTMNTGFDIELLAKELGRIEKIDMAKFGFDISSMEQEDGEVIEDDYTEPEQIQPKTKLGDVYRLGDHILMCGDSTKADDVRKLLGGGVRQFMRDRSSIQCCDRKQQRRDDKERQLGTGGVFKVLDLGVSEYEGGVAPRRRFLCLVRREKRSSVPGSVPGSGARSQGTTDLG